MVNGSRWKAINTQCGRETAVSEASIISSNLHFTLTAILANGVSQPWPWMDLIDDCCLWSFLFKPLSTLHDFFCILFGDLTTARDAIARIQLNLSSKPYAHCVPWQLFHFIINLVWKLSLVAQNLCRLGNISQLDYTTQVRSFNKHLATPYVCSDMSCTNWIYKS